jgi:hypothetical protein
LVANEEKHENINMQILWKIQNNKNIRLYSPILSKERSILKILNTINAVLSFIIIILAHFEYEYYYYPIFFENRDFAKESILIYFNKKLWKKKFYYFFL